MEKNWQRSLTIQGNNFSHKDLLAYSSDKIISINLDPWEKEIFRFIITWLGDSEYITQYSSGTTGKPKEIRLAKNSMMNSALNTCRFLGLGKENTALLCMPVDYIAGKMMIIRSFTCGLRLFYTEPKSMPELSGTQSYDLAAMVPLQVINSLSCTNDLPSIKKLLIGGAEISNTLEKLVEPLNTEVYATYGMAETSSHVALRRLNGSHPQKDYAALPGVQIETDNRGCLVISADYLPGKIVTNDLVELTGPASFRWLGRYDNLINSGGVKIVPEEVESMILAKTFLECVAIGLPDKKLGQKLVFVIEKDKVPDSLPTLKDDLSHLLPRFWKPRDIICVDQIPRNNAKKIDRIKLTEMIRLSQGS